MRKLPPLNSLKAFEVAAVHLSFSKAAKMLGVTQGAVSKQIKILEEYLGFEVFERLHQSLKLTGSGRQYLRSVSKALEGIENATANIVGENSAHDVLRVNILPSLSSLWLVPQLENYHKKYPHIQIDMDIGDAEMDLNKLSADIAIRSAKKPRWPKYYSKKFMSESLLPVYSARLRKENPIKTADDFKKHKLLKHTTRPQMWAEYLAYLNVKEPVKYGSGFEHFFMLIEAAKDSMGIALVPEFLIRKELAQKKLFVAWESGFESPYGYYFICSKPRIGERKIRDFQNWLSGL